MGRGATAEAHEPVFVLASGRKRKAYKDLGKLLSTPESVRDAFVHQRRAMWVAPPEAALATLLAMVEPRDTWHRLLMLKDAEVPQRERLSALFRVVVAPGAGVELLADEEILEILREEHPEDFFLGGVVDEEDSVLVLYRGNLERLVVPLGWFGQRATQARIDPDDFGIEDCGQTVRLGDYEAAADAILYEFDREARGRMKERSLDEDDSLGASIRRLRLQKGLGQGDFPGLSARTIARIERGEVSKPHRGTLAKIAKRLGVRAEDIESY